MNPIQLTTFALVHCVVLALPLVAQDQPKNEATPQLDWTGLPTRTLKPSTPDKDWGRYTDDECKAAWHAPSKPKRFLNKAKDYSATYESRDGRLTYQLTIAKTTTMFLGSPLLFFDAADAGFIGSLQKNKIKFSATPIAHLRYHELQGRLLKVKTDRMSFAVVYLVTDSLSFSFLVVGPDDQVESAIIPFVTSLRIDKPQAPKQSVSPQP